LRQKPLRHLRQKPLWYTKASQNSLGSSKIAQKFKSNFKYYPRNKTKIQLIKNKTIIKNKKGKARISKGRGISI
jgi:hypothetical protein